MKSYIRSWKWTRIAGALLLFLIGLSFIITPNLVAQYMALILGIFLIALGVLSVLFEVFKRKYRLSIIGLILGGAYLAIGIALVSIPTAILTNIVGIIVAILICAEGISTIAQAVYESGDSRYWPLKLIVGLITTGVGVFVMFHTSESTDILLIIIGAILIYIALSQLVTFIFLSGNEKKRVTKPNSKIIEAEVVETKVEETPTEEKK